MDNKMNKEDFEELEKSIAGNLFLANLFDTSADLDNSGINLAMYMEYQELKEIIENDKNKKL